MRNYRIAAIPGELHHHVAGSGDIACVIRLPEELVGGFNHQFVREFLVVGLRGVQGGSVFKNRIQGIDAAVLDDVPDEISGRRSHFCAIASITQVAFEV